MMDHLIEGDSLKNSCFYCLKSDEEMVWKSDFESDMHYKVHKCDCGRESRLRMPFYGSGDDTFNIKKKSIEDKL